MVDIIIATHGKLAEGLKDCVRVVSGEGDQIKTLSLLRDDNLDDFEKKFIELIEQAKDGAVVFVDMVGGSPYNVALKHLKSFDHYNVVSGVNANMILETLSNQKDAEVSQLSRTASEIGKQAVMEFGTLLASAEDAADEEKVSNEHAEAEIALSRVDHRLIHGQVVTKWSKIAAANTIIIVDDELAKDDYMIQVYRSSAPAGIEVIVAPTEVVGYAYQHGTLPSGKIMLLFRNLEMVKKALEEGLALDKLQLGGIPNDGSKIMVFQAVNLSKDDLNLLKEIENKGTNISIQVIPEEPGITLKDAERKFI